jgi:membrane associated rhomboid family serine protease
MTTDDDGIAPTSIPLRRTPPTRRPRHAALVLLFGVLPALVLPLAWFWWVRLISTDVAGVVLVIGGVAAVGWLAWLFALPRPAPIVVDDDAIDLPFGRRRLRLALTELLVARLVPEGVLLFAAAPPGQPAHGHGGGVLLLRTDFADVDGPLHLVASIRSRLARAHGEGYLARLDENERRQQAFQRRRPIVVQFIAGICGVVFLVELGTGAVESLAGLVGAGANASDLVADGALWRLVTANLLHGSWLHLGMNLAALLSTGALVERWLGRPGTLLVLWTSGVGGQLASALVAWVVGTPRVSVGISGAVFGVLGVLLVSTWRFRRHATGGLRVPAATWLLLLLTNGAISLIPMVDVAAHGGGFVVGAAVAVVVAPRPGRGPLLPLTTQTRAAAIAVGLALVSVIFLVTSLAQASLLP